MATCRECIHFADCLEMGKTRYYGKESACGNVEKLCKFFKPTADVVEVVRCKDCKHLEVLNNKTIYGYCEKTQTKFLPFGIDTRTHFCSYGERKEN